MASTPPSKEMEQEAMCPICQELLTDPVVLDCGHSFCQGCITKYCETREALEEARECPTCRYKIKKGGFRPNWQLANLIAKMKMWPVSSGKEDLCLSRKGKRHLFCKEDEKLICSYKKKIFLKKCMCSVSERSPEHQGHTVLLEQAAQQHKDKIFNCLGTLRAEREKILKYLSDVKNESQEMLKIMESQRQMKVDEFRTLHQLLNKQEKDLLAQIDEAEKEITRKRDENLAELSDELSSLENQIQEMEEKHQQPVSELLQDVGGTLQRYEKKTFENTEDFLGKLKLSFLECCHDPFLENAIKQFRDTLAWASPEWRATVTLDPASASTSFVKIWCPKKLQWQHTPLERSEDPEKCYGFVLGSEGFRAGCQFWDVLVKREEDWAVGVARKPVSEKVTFTPEEGIWAVGRWRGQYKAFIKGTDPPLAWTRMLYHIRVCLNYDERRVTFFDVKTALLVYEFSGVSFRGDTLYPFFAVYGDGCLQIYP